MHDGFRLSDFLPYQLAVLAERTSRRLAVDYGASHGLSVAEWRIMVHLQRSGLVSIRDIQIFTNLEKSRASRAVDRLVRAGMVEKQVSLVDARLVEIALTPRGQAVLHDLLPPAQAIETLMIEGLHPDDLASFYRVMEHFHKVLDADPKARPRMAADLERPKKTT